MGAPSPAPIENPWAPLRVRAFRALWIASLTSDIGGAMHGVGAGWLMTNLSPSPVVVSMVQAAATLPMFLLLLPAGALADIVDRRKLLIVSELGSMLAALAMAIVTLMGHMTPAILLALTFALAAGAALGTPGFQAVVPELVPKERVAAAAALGSMEFNIARAVGPALAGLVISLLGVGAVFLLNTVSFAATITVLWLWRRGPRSGMLPPEHFFPAMRVGWRYAARDPQFRIVLLRTVAFFSFASALWALLPIVGKEKLAGSPYGYSILLSCLGLGAIVAALALPRNRAALGPNRLVIAGSLVFAAATALAAWSDNFVVVCACMLAGGWAWLTCVTSLNVAARFALADWVMARGLAIYQMAFYGASTLGAVLWGQVAQSCSVDTALFVSAGAVAAASFIGHRARLSPVREDLEPSRHWRRPAVDLADALNAPAVLVTVEYRVKAGQHEAFAAAMRELGTRRLRNGAVGWHLYHDLERPGRYVEHFLETSWLDHLRHHERTTAADRAAEEKVGPMLDGPYIVSHLGIVP